jgi:uncharacterized protein YktA (UPF0223 family)
MAQMRVKDQDLIVEQVVSKIEATELEKFKAREDVKGIQILLDERIGMIKQLHDKYKEYEERIKADQKELKELVQSFQEVNGLDYSKYSVNQGFQLEGVSYGVGVPTYSMHWNLPYSTKRELSTKLRLQTMGGDFDVYKLIDELTSEFSS